MTGHAQIGHMSYGPLNVIGWGAENERLIIGNYVSISDQVVFLLGGNHPYKGVSTFPFKVRFFGYPEEAQSKGPIVVEDDVWIGFRSTILSGVTIGRGAVVGAGSVVARNIPAYTIATGVPARARKWRFGDNHRAIEKELYRIDYSKLTGAAAQIVGEKILYEELTADNVKGIVDMIVEACYK